MYKRILIATDGSELARTAIDAGLALATLTHAAVVAVHVRAPPIVLHGEAVSLLASQQMADDEAGKAASRKALADVEQAARRADVPCEVREVVDGSPANGILQCAAREHCDLIVMASHGRGVFARVLLGSETNKVLAHARQAVLVTR